MPQRSSPVRKQSGNPAACCPFTSLHEGVHYMLLKEVWRKRERRFSEGSRRHSGLALLLVCLYHISEILMATVCIIFISIVEKLCVLTCTYRDIHVVPEDLRELGLSFCHVGSGCQTQGTDGNAFTLCHLTGPHHVFKCCLYFKSYYSSWKFKNYLPAPFLIMVLES